jgi:hypothetical protein
VYVTTSSRNLCQILFRWVEGWYNPRRIQRALGWRSPAEYEQAYHAGHDLTAPATAKPAPVLAAVKAQNSLDSGCGPTLHESGERPKERTEEDAGNRRRQQQASKKAGEGHTARTPASKTASAAPKTPGSGGSRPATSRSTEPG